MDKLIAQYTKLPLSKINPAYRKIELTIGNNRRKLLRETIMTLEERAEIITHIKTLGILLRQTPSMLRTGTKIYYVRYADD